MISRPFIDEMSINELVSENSARVIEKITTAYVCDPRKKVRTKAREALNECLKGRNPKVFVYRGGIYLTLSEEFPYEKAIYVGNVPKTYIGQKTKLHLGEGKDNVQDS